MGEEVGYFGGAFKVTDGLLAVYGEKRVRDTPDLRTRRSSARASAPRWADSSRSSS